jgi:hypothetical protein
MAPPGATRAHPALAWIPHRPPLNSDRTALEVSVGAGSAVPLPSTFHIAEHDMSKGMDSKKNEKKKPAKTLKEKRAAKQEKKKGQ